MQAKCKQGPDRSFEWLKGLGGDCGKLRVCVSKGQKTSLLQSIVIAICLDMKTLLVFKRSWKFKFYGSLSEF